MAFKIRPMNLKKWPGNSCTGPGVEATTRAEWVAETSLTPTFQAALGAYTGRSGRGLHWPLEPAWSLHRPGGRSRQTQGGPAQYGDL